MDGNPKVFFLALAFVASVSSTSHSQPSGKGSDTKDLKVVQPVEKGVSPKPPPLALPETSHWAGYFSQPRGPYKWYYIEVQLTGEGGGQISGKCGLMVVGRFENIITKIKGENRDEGLHFKDLEVLQKTASPPGTSRWFTDRRFAGKLGPYGALLGDWSDASDSSGDGQIFLVRMDYHIVIQRQQDEADGFTRSSLSLNGVVLGDVYENTKKQIPAGVYPGRRRYVSPKDDVQSGETQARKKGDFLLEIFKIPKRKDVLIIPGAKDAKTGEGVIAGPAIKKGDALLAPPVLAALRAHFYGTDNAAVPIDRLYMQKESNIRIEFRNAPKGATPLPAMILEESSLPTPLSRPIRLENMIGAPKK